jgi:hypothetical protein
MFVLVGCYATWSRDTRSSLWVPLQEKRGCPRFFHHASLAPLAPSDDASPALAARVAAADILTPCEERVRAWLQLQQHGRSWTVASLTYWALWNAFRGGWALRTNALVRPTPCLDCARSSAVPPYTSSGSGLTSA